MSLAFIASTTKNGNNAKATSFSINVPSGVSNGDLLILIVGHQGHQSVTTPSGWTHYDSASQGTGSSNAVADIYYRVASSEPSSYTISLGFSFYGAIMAAYSGADGFEASGKDSSSSRDVLELARITTLGPDRLFLGIGVQNKFPAAASNLSASSEGSNTMTIRAVTDDTNIALILGELARPTAGLTPFNGFDTSVVEPWATIAISLAPAEDAGGTIIPTGIASAESIPSPTITGGAQPTSVSTDTWTRTTSSGWGTSDSGHDWEDDDDVTDFTADGSRGKVHMPNTSSPHNNVLGQGVAVAKNSRGLISFVLDTLPSSGTNVQIRFYSRRGVDLGDVGDLDADDIRHALRIRDNGSIEMQHDYSIDGTRADVSDGSWIDSGKDYTANEKWWVKYEVEGDAPNIQVRTKVWKDGDSEPSTFDLEEEFDPGSDNLDHSGATGVHIQSAVANSNVPFNLYFDDLDFKDLDNLSSAQSIEPNGVISAEAIGSHSVSPGAVALVITGISSAVAFGTASLGRGTVTVTPTAIESDEVLGSPSVNPGAILVIPTGVASDELVNNPIIAAGAVTLVPVAIDSLESIGSHRLSLKILPNGVSTAEALGLAELVAGAVKITPTGVASGEAVGSAVLSAGALALLIPAIDSEESVASPEVSPGSVNLDPSSIGSDEAFGTSKLNLRLLASAIASSEAFGTPLLKLYVLASGIASAEALGSPDLTLGEVTLLVESIDSAEIFGDVLVNTGQSIIRPEAVTSLEEFGSHEVSPGLVSIITTAISSGEQFGPLTVEPGPVIIITTGISSAGALGSPSLTTGSALVRPSPIASLENFGSTVLSAGAIELLAQGIASEEAFGTVEIALRTVLAIQAINSLEAFGATILVPGQVTIEVTGISSEEAFGLLRLKGNDLYSWAMQSGFIKTSQEGAEGVSGYVRTKPGGFANTQSGFRKGRN